MAGFDFSRDHVRVALRDVVVDAAVGLHPWERHPERPTRLVVNIEMYAYTEGSRTPFLDYDRLRQYLKTMQARPHTDLLETLAEELVTLCFDEARVDACRVGIAKTDIFNEAAAAEVVLFRQRGR